MPSTKISGGPTTETTSTMSSPTSRLFLWTTIKILLSIGFITLTYYNRELLSFVVPSSPSGSASPADSTITATDHRRLLEVDTTDASPLVAAATTTITTPTYMQSLMKDLQNRYDLFTNTPPEEIKYWFEYSGPLQVSDIFFHFGCCQLDTLGRDETHFTNA